MSITSPKKYHPIQVTLHWLVVLLVFAAFIIGKFMSGQPNDENKLMYLALHMMIGSVTMIVVMVRFVTRIKLPRPAHASTGNALLDWLGKMVHYALYLLVFLMSLSGILLSMQAGLAPIVFGGAGSLPVNFYDFTARVTHGLIAPALLALVALHVGAAIYHQFIIKDNLFARMWYGKL